MLSSFGGPQAEVRPPKLGFIVYNPYFGGPQAWPAAHQNNIQRLHAQDVHILVGRRPNLRPTKIRTPVYKPYFGGPQA